MIKKEIIINNNKEFLQTYRDTKHCILQVETENKYDEAYDIIPCRYTYTETEEEIKEIKE